MNQIEALSTIRINLPPLLPPGNLPRVDHNTTVLFSTEPTNEELILNLDTIKKMQHVPIRNELRYQLLHNLGSGGQANVWKAVDLATGELCGIKKLRLEYRSDPAYIGHFYQEALGLSYRHKYIVPVTNFFIVDDNYYLVMPFIDMPTVANLIDEDALKFSDI